MAESREVLKRLGIAAAVAVALFIAAGLVNRAGGGDALGVALVIGLLLAGIYLLARFVAWAARRDRS
jgi:hypothetical protein